MANTRYLSLELIELEGLTLADLVEKLNDSLEKIDEHNHTKTRQIPLSSVVANAGLDLNENTLLNTEYLTFLNNTALVSADNSLFFQNGELFCRDGSGRVVQLTLEGGNFSNALGNARGDLWASAPLRTTPDGNRMHGNFTAGPDKPDEVGLTNIVNMPYTPPDPSIIGFWAVVSVAGVEIDAVLVPWSKAPGVDRTAIKVGAGNTQTATLWFQKGASSGINGLQILATSNSGTIASNTTLSIYPAVVRGAQGKAGPIGPVGQIDYTAPPVNTNEDIVFAVQERPVPTTIVTPVARPSTIDAEWGDNVWSIEPNATAGSILLPLGDDIVLLSNTRIAYSSTTAKRAKNIWIGDTEYSVNWLVRTATLGSREVVYSELNDQLPVGPWRNLKIEFKDGTYNPAGAEPLRAGTLDKSQLHSLLDIKSYEPTQGNIYPTAKEILKAGANITITPNDANNELTIAGADVAVDTGPQIKEKLEALQGTERLDASAIQNIPSTETGASIKGKLEGLSGNDRLDASAVKNIPEGAVETGETIKTKLEGLNGNDRLAGSAVKDAQFIALDSRPTDLAPFADNQVLRVNFPAPGKWFEVEQFTASGHALKVTSGLDTEGQVQNRGFDIVGANKFGSVETIEGTALNENTSPVGRIQFQHDPGGPGTQDDAYTIQVLIKKSSIPVANQGLNPLFMAIYSGGVPSEDTFEDVFPLAKQADTTTDGVVYQEYTFTITSPSRYNEFVSNLNLESNVFYVEFYQQFTTYASRGDVWDILQEKSLVEIDTPQTAVDSGIIINESTITPSLAQGNWATEQQISLAGVNLATDVSVDSNTITFAKQGYFTIEGSFFIQSDTPSSQSNNIRAFPQFFLKKNNTKDDSSGATFYIRGSGTYLGAGNANNAYKFNHTLKINAGDEVTLHAISKNQQPTAVSLTLVGGQSQVKVTGIEGLKGEKGDAGSTTTLTPIGPSEGAVFQVPTTASTTLRVTTAGVPAFYNIPRLTGSGIVGKVTTSQVSNIARVNIGEKGHINLSWEDEVMLEDSNVGTGGDGEFVWAITQYDKDGNDLRSWLNEHPISDPIRTPVSFPFSILTGMTPVSVGDYFTFNFAFNVNQANRILEFSLPADNPGLDERIELFFFPEVASGGVDYDAPRLDLNDDFKVAVQEQIPGGKSDADILFSSNQASDPAQIILSMTNPFPGVDRIGFWPNEYGSTADEQTNRNRFFVEIPTANFVDEEAPEKLQIRTNQLYALSYYETDAGKAVYRTAVIPSDDRITAGDTLQGTNIQKLDQSWFGRSDDTTANKTLTKADLQAIANSLTSVHIPPTNPVEGMRIEMLDDYSIQGGAIFKPANADTEDNTGWSATLGSLIPAPPANSIDFLLAYRHGTPNVLTDKVTIWRNSSNTETPRRFWLNGISYPMVAIGGALPRVWYAQGLAVSDIQAGRDYYFNLEYASGSFLYPNITLRGGQTYVWSGIHWQPEGSFLEQDEIEDVIDSRVLAGARTNSQENFPFARLPIVVLTLAQYNALAVKDSNTLYFTT